MSDCPRVYTKEQMRDGLRRPGSSLNVDRSDAPELVDLRSMVAEGLLVSRLIEIDEQSSVLKFTWNPMRCRYCMRPEVKKICENSTALALAPDPVCQGIYREAVEERAKQNAAKAHSIFSNSPPATVGKKH